MTEFHAGQFDIAVIGAGHAGIEAALAAARLGMRTIVFTINLDAVGNMPCNPAIGGTGKGHLVRELDALGGEMAKAADACCIQYRLLNKGKGPAVWSLRAQADRRKYQERMKHTLELQENLTVRQGEVVEIRTEQGAVSAVVLSTGAVFQVKAAILATGTYLSGRTIIGECVESSGPDGMHPALRLTDSLLALGLPLRRFKTGTPPPGQRPQRGLRRDGAPARGRAARALLLCHRRPAGKPGGVLADLDHRGDQTDRSGKSGPGPHVLRPHRRGGAPVLPVL